MHSMNHGARVNFLDWLIDTGIETNESIKARLHGLMNAIYFECADGQLVKLGDHTEFINAKEQS